MTRPFVPRATTVLVLTLLMPAASRAQLPRGFVPEVEDVVEQGDRVRVSSERTSGEFEVSSVGPTDLLLRAQPDIQLEILSLTNLQVSRGRQITTSEGFFGGSAVGALVGIVLGLQDIQTHYSSLTRMSMKESAAVGAGIGALVGLFVSYRSDEVWQEVALAHRLDDSAPLRQAATPEATDPVVVVGDVGSNDLVELTVRNRSPDPINAFAWWEGGPRVSLGLVRANSTAPFITARRSPGVVLVVNPISVPGPPRGPAPRPAEFIVVSPDERLQWVVLESNTGVVEDWLRLTAR